MIAEIAGAAISGLAGLFGQKQANKVNQREAQKNRDFQSAEALKQRDFQAEMSNTAFQRQVEDMRAAGLNPAMALQGGGASSPSGASGGGSQAAAAGDVVSSAMQAMSMKKQLQILDATARKTREEARSARADADVNTTRAGYLTNRFSVNGRHSVPLLHDMIDAEVSSARWGAENMRAISERSRSLAEIEGIKGGAAERLNALMWPLIDRAGGAANEFIRNTQRRFKKR